MRSRRSARGKMCTASALHCFHLASRCRSGWRKIKKKAYRLNLWLVAQLVASYTEFCQLRTQNKAVQAYVSFVSIREGYAFCGCSLVANEFCSYEVQLYRCKRSKCVHERREQRVKYANTRILLSNLTNCLKED